MPDVLELALLGGGIYLTYLFVTATFPVMVAMAWQLILSILRAPFEATQYMWHNALWDAGFGLALGIVIGLLRYVFRIHKHVVEDIVDAMWSPDTVGLAKLGLFLTHIVFHALCGALAGLVIGLIGIIQLPELLLEDISVLPESKTAAVHLLALNGFFAKGGAAGGGGPPDASPFLALVVIFLVALLIMLFVSVLSAVGFAVVGRAMLSGTISGFFKSSGSLIVLFLTRWWSRYGLPTIPKLPPLDFKDELDKYMQGMTEHDSYPLNYYWDFLKERNLPITVETVVGNFPAFEEETKQRVKRDAPRVVRGFVFHLGYELKKRDPSQYPADALPHHLLCPGWFWWALARGTWVGMMVSVLNVLVSMICLILAGVKIRS